MPDGEGENVACASAVDRPARKNRSFTIRHIYAVNMSGCGDNIAAAPGRCLFATTRRASEDG